MRIFQGLSYLLLLFVCLRGSAQKTLLESVIHEDSLHAIVKYLASDSLKGRFTGTMANMKAAEFIANEFRKAGVKPFSRNQGYLLPFTATPPGKVITSYNVVAALPGKSKPDEIIIFSAHFDHVGTASEVPAYMQIQYGDPDPRDQIFNGANDDASGVAGVIALAKYYSKLKNNERTLLFVAFSGEELGMQGSRAMRLNFKPETIMAVVNLEMIGRTPTGGPAKPFVTGAALSDFRDALNDELEKQQVKNFGKNYFRGDAFMKADYFERSDNYPFAEMGVPAHSIMLGNDLDRFYHTVDDEMETLNYTLMARVVQAVALACNGLVNGTVILKRIGVKKKENPPKANDTLPRQRAVRDQ